MQIRHVLIKVDNQDKALAFYTSVLGFKKKVDAPMGQFRWLTVFSIEGSDPVELVLEPNSLPPALASQKALYDAGFPAIILTTNNIKAEYERLKGVGVKFRGEPKNIGPAISVFFEDTCGNLINLVQSAA